MSLAVKALSALAHESRLAIFRLVIAAGPSGVSAGEIAERLEVPRPTLSFHLSQLSGAGLLEDRKEGRSVIYAARMEGIRELLDYLIKDCCQGEAGGCEVSDLAVLKNCQPPGSAATRG